ncbi:hypothetical protein ZOSMA_183G00410 [Zostera marina]|uniref:Myosin heavy chain-related protein n=1 Tax=Zostera marina TaxID=29655 RepID=A0A0K9PSU3_ZOSMR|nr:hypothetical protein ZOSMA_183G00410 [Zostera marina]
MDDRSTSSSADIDGRSASFRIQQLEQERDQLRKDIESICLKQVDPGFLGVATRIHLQRNADLEQEINSLKKKIAAYSRDNQNLQEEISESYRMKSRLDDLCREEAAKNAELGKQVKFFQGCIAAAFSERDRAVMEYEMAKEQMESIPQKLIDSEYRIKELESACADLWKDNSALGIEFLTIKERILPLEKVVSKFCKIREETVGYFLSENWEEKCSRLLDDSSEMWIFEEDGESSTHKYIIFLESELQKMRNSMEHHHSKMKMGLEIEQYLKRKVQSLEKKLVELDSTLTKGLLGLHDFHRRVKVEILSCLEEQSIQIKSSLMEVNDKIRQYDNTMEQKIGDIQIDKSNSIDSDESRKMISHERLSTVTVDTSDYPDVLALALKEKVSALLLLSQQEERHLLERNVNGILQRKIEDMQKNLFQVTNEKVQVLMELANLKRELELQQENCNCGWKRGNNVASNLIKDIYSQRDGSKLKDFWKKAYKKHWIGENFVGNETAVHVSSNERRASIKKNLPIDLARCSLKIENDSHDETILSMEHLNFSINKLRTSILKARNDVTPNCWVESEAKTLEDILLEAHNLKEVLICSLPLSWSAELCDSSKSENPDKLSDVCEASQNEKLDPVSTAGFEMVELLILAAELQKEINGMVRNHVPKSGLVC